MFLMFYILSFNLFQSTSYLVYLLQTNTTYKHIFYSRPVYSIVCVSVYFSVCLSPPPSLVLAAASCTLRMRFIMMMMLMMTTTTTTMTLNTRTIRTMTLTAKTTTRTHHPQQPHPTKPPGRPPSPLCQPLSVFQRDGLFNGLR